MTALSADRLLEKRDNVLFPTFEELPVGAGVKIYQGALVGLIPGTVGAVPASANPALRVLGVSVGSADGEPPESTIDNTGGAAGAKKVKIERGIFPFANDATAALRLTNAHRNMPCYVVDDQTVSASDNNGTRPQAGIFLGIDPVTSLCWVQVGVGLQGQVIETGQAGADLQAHQYGWVKLSAGKYVACSVAGEHAVGILQNAPDTDGLAIVCTFGPSLLKAGSAGYTAGAILATDASGLGKDAVAGTTDASGGSATAALVGSYGLARARETATSGQVRAVFVTPVGAIPTTAA